MVGNQSFASDSENSELWVWDNNSPKHTFSVRIHKEIGRYIGSYCAVGMSGRRIDCSPKSTKKFTFSKGRPEFTFVTNYSGAKGRAKLTEDNGMWVWKIIEQPNGEHYAPNHAYLSKQVGKK